MSNDEQPEKVWDEYAWERFLQEQDRKTEKYMELLERYIDDPNRDQIIAREMGWNHLLNKEGQEWADHVDSQFSEEAHMIEDTETESADAEEEQEDGDGFELNPLYQASFALTAWIDQMFEECGAPMENHPVAVKLSTNVQVASSKLAAALSGDDVDEIGMTIAYLKRALCALITGLDCAVQLREEGIIEPGRFGALNQRLFQVRDGIIQLMGEKRFEWRRRYGR